MDFSIKDMQHMQKESVRLYYESLQHNISKILKTIALDLPYINKVTITFVNEAFENTIEQPYFLYIDMGIFKESMFDDLADWLANLGYMTRKFWFSDSNNNNGEIASISLSW